jgi:hypothetical protein
MLQMENENNQREADRESAAWANMQTNYTNAGIAGAQQQQQTFQYQQQQNQNALDRMQQQRNLNRLLNPPPNYNTYVPNSSAAPLY